MSGLSAQIKQARPKLSEVAPLTSAICWGYAVTNMLLGLGMYFLYETTVAPIAVANILSYDNWGILFFLVGLVSAFALVTNRWALTRHMQLAGLAIKAIWAIALMFRCIEAPQTIVITIVWLFFAYIQAAVYVFFIPGMGRRRTDDE